MQFNILTTVLAAASLAAAAPTTAEGSLDTRATCVYATGNYAAYCKDGTCINLTGLCTGSSGLTESFTEAGAVSANIAACAGIATGKGCVRTAACCK